MYHSCNCETSSQTSSESDMSHSSCTCCRCKNKNKSMVKGKFGLAYVVETPKKKITTPAGWQIEFEDTPSGIIENCNRLVDWVNYPPLGNCHNCFLEYPPACSKILKPRNALLTTSTQYQCLYKDNANQKNTSTNTCIKRNNGTLCSCSEPVCNKSEGLSQKMCFEPKIINCDDKSTQNPSRKSCCCQNSKHQCQSQNVDQPMHYQGCYWYTDHNLQHCWCTTQKIGINHQDEVEKREHSTSCKSQENLDYVPIREGKKDIAQIIRLKDGETQCKEKKISTHEKETLIIKNVSNKQVGTISLEVIKAPIAKNTKEENDIKNVEVLTVDKLPVKKSFVKDSNEKNETLLNSELSKNVSNKLQEEFIGKEDKKILEPKELPPNTEVLGSVTNKNENKKPLKISPEIENFKIQNFKNIPKNEIFSQDMSPMQKIKLALKIKKNEIQLSKNPTKPVIKVEENKEKIISDNINEISTKQSALAVVHSDNNKFVKEILEELIMK